jgi:hypothetical protein
MPSTISDALIKILPQLGTGGMLIAVLLSVIYYMNRHIERREIRHQKERGEWRQQIREQSETMRRQIDTMIGVAEKCAIALTEISTLIKIRCD